MNRSFCEWVAWEKRNQPACSPDWAHGPSCCSQLFCSWCSRHQCLTHRLSLQTVPDWFLILVISTITMNMPHEAPADQIQFQATATSRHYQRSIFEWILPALWLTMVCVKWWSFRGPEWMSAFDCLSVCASVCFCYQSFVALYICTKRMIRTRIFVILVEFYREISCSAQ